jgi:UDP-N-acetylglucosamine--N-acetylmuramyl-(pentapeptide) pyrophosphoryl-undecaprenol N-acetylglucosamine transferase
MEERIVPERGIEIETLRVRGVQPEAWRNLALAFSVPAAVLSASRLVGRFQPDVVFGTGGYVVAPVGIAASLRRRPLVLQLPDAVPGRTIRTLAPRAETVCLEFESSAAQLKGRTQVTGTPVRPEFAAIGRARRAQSRAVVDGGFRLVVFGGSQGAHRLNTAVAEGLKALLAVPGLAVHHLSGEQDHDQLRAMRSGLDDDLRDRYTVEPFSDAIAALMESADLILARAGGSAIAEMTSVGAPMVLVPYPHAGAHQRFNAEPVAKAGAAIVVPDEELSGVRLVETVRRLITDPDRLRRMAQASLDFGRPDAAEAVARIVVEAAR